MYRGDDLYFHLNRIEGLALGIRNGDFIPKINHFFLYGMGYGSPIFYSDIFLYPASLLRILGLSISNSYIIFLIGINFMTYLIAYYSFLFYKKVPFQAFLFAVLYGTASYRLSDLTERAAVGEVLALAFIPLAFVGVWSIFEGESDKFYLLSLGMAALILSHVLSAFIFSLFILVYLLFNIRHVIGEKTRTVAFFKAAGLTIVLCLGFLVPLAEQVAEQSFTFQTSQVAQLSQEVGSIGDYLNIAIRNSGFNNLGLLMIGLLIFLALNYSRFSKQARRLLIMTGLFLFVSTSFFPHRLLDHTVMNAIQFPWRLFSIVTFCVCWLFAENYSLIVKNEHGRKLLSYSAIAIALMLVFTHSLFVADTDRLVSRDQIEQLPSAFLGWGNEYIPSGTDFQEVIQAPKTIRNSKGITLENVTFDYGAIDLAYQIDEKDSKEAIVFPFIYYKGYQAKVNGKMMEVYNSPTFPGLSELRLSGKGTVHLAYYWTRLQLLSATISVGSWLLLVVWLLRQNKKKQKIVNEKDE
ncbi:hypothetical protein [Enterococcus wangshanyuanii]|uniref:Membrane protein n=1 Tax=Enterococcus wangshanyuanii TaxID=2005703 RepID=A0ABQ1NJ09_9ENTE|nr:hypothetical protein [Enterococcus wangshanyuanii]GGC78374.1 membrane protein [Enterococcus wangshanyuanii]